MAGGEGKHDFTLRFDSVNKKKTVEFISFFFFQIEKL